MTNKVMQIGDPEPPIIPSDAVLRKAKEECRNEFLGIQKNSKLIESLVELKKAPKTGTYLRDDGILKTTIPYWSKKQIEIHNKIQKTFGHSISVDASSGVSRKIRRKGVYSPSIFLYNIVSHIGKTIVPVAQLLSEKQDTATIIHWFSDLIKCGFKIPRLVR